MDTLFSGKQIPNQVFIVVGDVMLDKVTRGSLKGIANEAPIPVFKKASSNYLIGGAGNVAANLAALGSGATDVHVVGLVGSDTHATVLKSLFHDRGIHTTGLYSDAGRPTICKHRYYVANTLLFRSDDEFIAPATADAEDAIMGSIKAIRMCADEGAVVKIVLSDYAKGALTTRLRREIIAYANCEGIQTFVDPKTDLSEYYGCTFMKPNKNEAARLGGIHADSIGLANAHAAINQQTGCAYSLITMAEQGMSLGYIDAANRRRHIHNNQNKKLEVIDVTGAGDVVLAVIAYIWGFGIDYERCLRFANAMGCAAVMHCGTYVATAEAVASAAAEAGAGAGAGAGTTKTVFTNGCFDLLHVGHLRLLKAASECGNHLIVGLNSDASVRRLKGPSRPIRQQDARAEMLLALPWVNEVRIFDEDTPAALIAEIRPAVLVKGGDYTLEQIVGREHAGEVRIFPFQEGPENSTSKIINTVLGNK